MKCCICNDIATNYAFIDGIGFSYVCQLCGEKLNNTNGMNGMGKRIGECIFLDCNKKSINGYNVCPFHLTNE